MLAGIGLIGWDGIAARHAGDRAWVGDLLFFTSSILWAGFTLLLRHWRLNALRATAVVAVFSCLLATPVYLAWMGTAHLLALPLGALAFQGLAQGGLQGVVTMIAYGQAVMLMGVSRAVLFPAIVPAVSVLVGIPIVGEIPGLLQIAGLGLVTLGLLITIGVLRRLVPRAGLGAGVEPREGQHLAHEGADRRHVRPATHRHDLDGAHDLRLDQRPR